MAITTVRIHPAIGVTRVGNATSDFFIGPERPGEAPQPPGGFKTNGCEVRRQGARFRLYAYDENDELIGEVTPTGADSISWTVHLVNSKATSPTRSPAGENGQMRNPAVLGPARDAMVIDPGSRTLSSPNAIALFNTGTFSYPVGGSVQTKTIPLGEMRTDSQGRLIVLGGLGDAASFDAQDYPIVNFYNNPGWYDDTSDGPVSATVVIDGTTYEAEGAWVVCGPPDYAPATSQLHSLYDHLVEAHWAPAPGEVGNGGQPSYTQHIYPLLVRAASAKWTRDSQQPTTLDPSTAYTLGQDARTTIVNAIKTLPGGVTAQQLQILNRWRDGEFNADWTGTAAPTTITPEGLDRAALEACIGAPFYPGIEAGVWVDELDHFSAKLRIDHATVKPGDVTQRMAVPWQADFYECAFDNWWPTQRPNSVIVAGHATRQSWARNIGSKDEMITEWSDAGFVVPQGNQQIEVEHCISASVLLRTPVVAFEAEQGPGGLPRSVALPIVFEVTSPDSAVSLQISSSLANPFTVETTAAVTSSAGAMAQELTLWVRYESQPTVTQGTSNTASVTVSEVGGSRAWTVQLQGRTTARTQTLVALVLDRSGSMAGDRGDGGTKIQALREASSIFIDAMLKEDAVAVVRYNHDAQPVIEQPVVVDDQTGPESVRQDIKDEIASDKFEPTGATSIGDGIEVARGILDAHSNYAERVILVLTDGNENSPKSIEEASPSINDKVFAVGLGRPENTSTAALQTLTGQHGGYMLVTGDITPEKQQLLTKYFLQILAGLSNAQVVLDPDGALLPGDAQEIPFRLTEATYGLDVFLLGDSKHLRFALRTPSGELVTPQVAAAAHPRMFFVPRPGMQLYRLAVPAEVAKDRLNREGTWTAIIYRPQRKVAVDGQFAEAMAHAARTHKREKPLGEKEVSIPYSVMVNAYTDLEIETFAVQTSRELGGEVAIGVSATQWGIPLDGLRAFVEFTSPRGRVRSSELGLDDAGLNTHRFQLNDPGIHRARIRVVGRSRAGIRFERETTRTMTVWPGGDKPPRPSSDKGGGPQDPGDRDDAIVRELLREFVACRGEWTEALATKLRDCGLDPEEWRELVSEFGRHQSKDGDPKRDTPPPLAFRIRKRLRRMLEHRESE